MDKEAVSFSVGDECRQSNDRSLGYSFTEFAALMVRELQLPTAVLSLHTNLFSDLDLDSIEIAELIVLIEETAGRSANGDFLEGVEQLETAGDAYRRYRSLAGWASSAEVDEKPVGHHE